MIGHMIREDRLVQLFLNLCHINSPSLQEAEVVEWTKGYLREHGLEFDEDDAGKRIGGNANNLIVRLPGTLPGAPRVFLSAHFDTVEPTPHIVVVEEDGVFRTDGRTVLGSDDKAGLAPAIEAVLALRESGLPHGDVFLLLTVAEEIGLKGAEALRIEELGLDFGYVLDTNPPVGDLVTRTATHDKLEVTIRGKAAHSGKEPEKGVSAIQVFADAVSRMKLGRVNPETTANLGIVEGGTAVNVVCPFVKVRGEARSTSVPDLDAQVDHMVQEFERAAREWGATVEVVHERHYTSYDLPLDSEVVQVAMKAATDLGFEPKTRTTLGGSDANVFNAKGVPTAVMACGMDKVHTHEERIKRQDLVDTARIALQVLLEVARR